MKSKKHERNKKSIEQLRSELHQLIEKEELNSNIVQKRSEELDDLILMYYENKKECQELKDP